MGGHLKQSRQVRSGNRDMSYVILGPGLLASFCFELQERPLEGELTYLHGEKQTIFPTTQPLNAVAERPYFSLFFPKSLIVWSV